MAICGWIFHLFNVMKGIFEIIEVTNRIKLTMEDLISSPKGVKVGLVLYLLH